MSFTFKVLARNPPTALFVIGLLMLLTGTTMENQELINFGKQLFGWGIILQILWLLLRFKVLEY